MWEKDETAEARRDRLTLDYGLDVSAARTASTSKKICSAFVEAYEASGMETGSPLGNVRGHPHVAPPMLLYSLVTKMHPDIPRQNKGVVFECIGQNRLTRTAQLEAAIRFLHSRVGLRDVPLTQSATPSNPAGNDDEASLELQVSEFEEACGVNVVITDEQIQNAVQDQFTPQVMDQLVKNRYRFNKGPLLGKVMASLKFAEGSDVRAALDARILAILGPPTEDDAKKPAKKQKEKQPPPSKTQNAAQQSDSVDHQDPFVGIPTNLVARDMPSAVNSPELVAAQKKASDGKVICRFPPEPNGYLHIGHAKAMFMDFGYAKKAGGSTILRFDDTNPGTEKQEYIDSIIEMVQWMGHKPAKITYSSDYFDQLYQMACDLIKRDRAYVCHQTADQIKEDRINQRSSPWRNRPTEESLKLFSDMRKGKIAEGAAALRMKINMQSDVMAMRDPVGYRIIFKPHPRTSDKWCVYPTYDFTHCLVDSLEWITHSFCTLEFEARRDSYYWLLEALDQYRPFVWEFSRLVLEHTIVSKRKLAQIVESGAVRGWDDPRMPTLMAARRRGYPPSAINAFCATLGVKRTDNNVTEMKLFEHCIRSELNDTAPRAMCVLDPIKVTIENFETNERKCTVPNHPTKPSMGTHEIPLTSTVYIERSDFRLVDSKKYHGLALGKTAMLKYAFPVVVKEVVTSSADSSKVEELIVTMDFEVDFKKTAVPKGVLHWVPDETKSSRVEVRLYEHLFESRVPDSARFLEELNSNSEKVILDAMLDPSASRCAAGDTFQFERTGYFTCDPDSTATRLVFNSTVSLREKAAARNPGQ